MGEDDVGKIALAVSLAVFLAVALVVALVALVIALVVISILRTCCSLVKLARSERPLEPSCNFWEDFPWQVIPTKSGSIKTGNMRSSMAR